MKKYSFLALFLMLLLGSGCDVSSTTEKPDEVSGTVGYLVDAPISGVRYECGSRLGTTNAEGKFQCVTLPVHFSVGTLLLGSIIEFTDDSKVYPQDLLNIERSNFTDSRLIIITRFLQSLDDDGSYEDGINIPTSISDKFLNYSVLFRESALDEYMALAGVALVSEEYAMAHLKKNMSVLGDDKE